MSDLKTRQSTVPPIRNPQSEIRNLSCPFLLKADPVFFDKLLHNGVVTGIELVHGAVKNELPLVKQGHMVRYFFSAIGDVMGDDYLRQAQLALHFADELVDRL